MPENDPSEELIEFLPNERSKPTIDLGEIMIEDGTELEATELELQWYRAVARSMEYYGRQYLFAWSSLGLSMAYMILTPFIESGSFSWPLPKAGIIVLGILLPLLLIGCGFGAWKSSRFPKVPAKFTIVGLYDVTITRGGLRRWFGYYTLLMPRSLEETINQGQRYIGEGFIVSKGNESWCIPTRLGEWTVSEKDPPPQVNRVLGWFIFAIFQFGWPIFSWVKFLGSDNSSGTLSIVYTFVFWTSFLGWLFSQIILGGILIHRAMTKKQRADSVKSGIPSP